MTPLLAATIVRFGPSIGKVLDDGIKDYFYQSEKLRIKCAVKGCFKKGYTPTMMHRCGKPFCERHRFTHSCCVTEKEVELGERIVKGLMPSSEYKLTSSEFDGASPDKAY